MKNLLRYLAFVLMVGAAFAQSNLPPCADGVFGIFSNPANWSNCFGSTSALGDKFKGDSYVGEFKEGKFHGQGKYIHLNGNIYIGEYKNGKRDGQGTFTIPSGAKYVGEFKDGKPNGQGIDTYVSGNKYVGNFKDGKADGQGTYFHLADGQWKGDKYVGEHMDGKRSGQGAYIRANGNVLIAEFSDGLPNGRFIEYKPDGIIYRSGIYEKNLLVKEEYISPTIFNRIPPDSNPVVANFQSIENERQKTEGKVSPYLVQQQSLSPVSQSSLSACLGSNPSVWDGCIGTDYSSSGNQYVGEYKNGRKSGRGTLFSSFSGSIISQGTWENDILIRSELLQQATAPGTNLPTCLGVVIKWSDCVGTIVYPNGAKHTGEFRYGEKFGRGIEYDHRGAVSRDGYWNDYRFFKDIDAFQIALGEKKSPQPTSELERLRAEAEEAKRKQSELEAQLKLAQQPVTQQSSPSNIAARNSKRIALVIGNAAYNSAPLKNPLNDATDISLALRQSGFEVIDQRNATLQEMTKGIREFGDKLLKSDVGLVYYSGHGLEVKGRNYLLPVNASMIREDEIAFQAIDANLILEKMNTAKKSVNILIVDACRDNPFARSFRSVNRGLAQMDAPTGTIVSFSTAPGKTASDGDGRNSPFTKNLVKAMMRADMPIEAMFKEVRKSVVEETKGQQTPWESSSLIGDFYFKASK